VAGSRARPAARLAVVGGGWAGLAAAVEAARCGWQVTLFEMAHRLGGRARSVDKAGTTLDNGQHILIGAYAETRSLLRELGVDESAAFLRCPLQMVDAAGRGLALRPGAPGPAFAGAVARNAQWRVSERLALLAAAARWWIAGFRCEANLTVADLTAHLPAAVRDDFIDPLCVAALNTPAPQASARVFLRVLHDALFLGPGSADLLLPRCDLGALLPEPAQRRLALAGATLRPGHRVDTLERLEGRWSVDGEPFDRVVLASSASEAARLARSVAPEWSALAGTLAYEPIVTVYLRADHNPLPAPMVALRSDMHHPAQFAFDRGQLGAVPELLAFVVSGAQAWVERGPAATVDAVVAQCEATLARHLRGPVSVLQAVTEKRATFRCTPGLRRPPMGVADGLLAAGDYVDGPYPATLEGAVRSGRAAVRSLG
jgi:squalene-associated FAD-dependent desaturase